MSLRCFFTQAKKVLGVIPQGRKCMRVISTTRRLYADDNDDKPVPDRFEKAANLKMKSYFDYPLKNRKTFKAAILVYKDRERRSLKTHVAFITAALKVMKEYGVEQDRELYRDLMDIFPKDTIGCTNMFQSMSYHYGLQQGCAINILHQMEANRIIPDFDLEDLVLAIFGRDSQVYRKIQRMFYWMPKMKYLSKWLLPDDLPEDTLDLAVMAVRRMATVDPSIKVTVFNANVKKDEGWILRALPSRQSHKGTDKNYDVTDIDHIKPEAPREEWIVSAISHVQRDLIKRHNKEEALKVEGPFRIFLKDIPVSYFILRAEPRLYPPEPTERDYDDCSHIFNWIKNERRARDALTQRTIHEQDDGIILAICSTENSSKSSLLSWIRILQKDSPELIDIPILFPQTSPIGDVIKQEDSPKTGVKAKA